MKSFTNLMKLAYWIMARLFRRKRKEDVDMIVQAKGCKDTTIVIDGDICIRCNIPDGVEDSTEIAENSNSITNTEGKEEESNAE